MGVFIFLAYGTLLLSAPLMLPVAGYLAAAALSTFTAAAVANAIALRIFERGHLADIGMGWGSASARNLGLGLAGGIGAAIVVLVGPLAAGKAELRAIPNAGTDWGGIVFVSILLLFGAVGEEMLFRGYAFQVLIDRMGAFAVILPTAVLFGVAHSGNVNVTQLGIVNTVAWGILFGFAFLRSGDLWLPIGLHYGWNVTMPLFGVNLSGFTMGVTGYVMHWNVGALWSGGEYGPEGGLLTSIVVVALFFYLLKAPIQKQRAFLLRSSEEV